MEKTIWKFELDISDKQFIQMPFGAEILCVQTQNEKPCLWALVNPQNTSVEFCFEMFGTGDSIYEDMGVDRAYIGTFQLNDGLLVFHLFERF